MIKKDKTKDELIKELHDLRQENNSLKELYEKDITKHKLAEERLRESKLKYRNLLEQAPDTIFLVDAEGNLLHVNLAGQKMLGYSIEELRKMKTIDTYPIDEMTNGHQRLRELRVMRARET